MVLLVAEAACKPFGALKRYDASAGATSARVAASAHASASSARTARDAVIVCSPGSRRTAHHPRRGRLGGRIGTGGARLESRRRRRGGGDVERMTRLELATSTLGRSRSTN